MPKISDAAAARKMLHDKLDELLNRAEETAKDPHKFKDVDKLVRDEVLSLGEGVVRFGIEAAAPTLRLRARETPCPHCKKPIYDDDEALLCLYCGESLKRGIGFMGKLKYPVHKIIIMIIATLVLVGFVVFMMR